LNVNGTVNNGGFTLAIAGAAHTIFGSSAVISGSGGLAKVDAGTLSIWSASSYAGATDVYSGTLVVNGSTSSNATTTVASGATLGGKGAIAGAVTVSGTLAPGDSIESLSTGALIMSSGSTLAYEANAPGGLGADLIVANGALALNNVTLDLSAATLHTGWIAGTKITLISYTGTAITSGFAGYVDDTQYAFGSNNWLFDYNDTSSGANFQSEASGTSFVTMTLIPEPSAAMLTGLGLGALLFLRCRRSHSV
jgi:autotransporter-associated beta strand protein